MNTGFSVENAATLQALIQDIQMTFGDAVFCMPERSLHMTLLDWIAPLIDYDGQNKNQLFAQIQPEYDQAMTEILASVGPIEVEFDELRVSPSTIFMIGRDDGSFERIRQQFLDKVELLPGTKPPPQIIHSSLARIVKSIDMDPVKRFLASRTIDLEQTVTEFRLVHTMREPMLETNILKRYVLLKNRP